MSALDTLTFATPASIIALEAGALLRDFYRKGVATEYKSDVDLVTEADRATEKLIVERLTRRFRSMEFTAKRERGRIWRANTVVHRSAGRHDELCAWVSCVLRVMGLERRGGVGLPAGSEDGEVVAGVIYDPLRDEMFTAERGKGAYLNGARIHVSRTRELAESLTATGFPSQKRHDSPNIHFYQEFTLRSHGVRRAGSAGLDLAYTACGRIDGFWEFHLNPWDTAAGVLLVTEAGGTMSRYDGSAFRLDSEKCWRRMVCCARRCWDSSVRCLRGASLSRFLLRRSLPR